MTHDDTFVEIPGCPGYHANTLGQIRGRRGRVLKPHFSRGEGCARVGILSPTGRTVPHSVARLVWQTFVGEPGEGNIVSHVNGDSADNRLQNLAIKRAGQNSAKLADSDVIDIINRFLDGEWPKDIAQDYGVATETIRNLLRRDSYEHIDLPGALENAMALKFAERNHSYKLSSCDVEVIRERLQAGEIQARIAEDYGVSPALITRIKQGSRHKL